MNKIKSIVKISLDSSKPSYYISVGFVSAIFLELLLYIVLLPNYRNGYLSMSNMLLLNLLIYPIIASTVNFKKMLNIGVKKNEFVKGVFLSYVILSTLIAVVIIIINQFEVYLIQFTNLWYINIIDTFGWMKYGFIGCLLYQISAYTLLMSIVHLIAFSNTFRWGWFVDVALSSLLLVFLLVKPLREILSIQLGRMFFHPNLLMQFIMDVILIFLYYCIAQFIARKKNVR